MNPFNILQEAIKAVPSLKYALAVTGIFAVIAIISSFSVDYRIAIFGIFVIIILMIIMVIFARISAAPSRTYAVPALVMTWFSLLLFMATSLLLFTSVFFKIPLDLKSLLKKDTDEIIKSELPEFIKWHAKKTQFEAEILMNDLTKSKIVKDDYFLLLVCMKEDKTISYLLNKNIQKSNFFPITKDIIVTVNIPFSDEFENSLDPGSIVRCHICLIEKEYSKRGFNTLSDLERMEGIILKGVYETIK
jgi:hypothetical protein